MTTVTIRSPVDAKELPQVDTQVDAERDVVDLQTPDVFPQSVASGGPAPEGVILWTRINPDHYDPSKKLRLEVATNASFQDNILRTEFSGPGVKATDNYTIRVDLNNILEPDTTYYYRFGYRGVKSQTGRCRTLPPEDVSVESLQFGVLNCQNYQNGYFGAMAHLAETDVDFILHLGDYIYEHVADGYPNGEDGPYEDRRIDLPNGETRPLSLDDFRHIYEIYKTDPHLQRLHERHTVIQTWDDHAIANDRYWDYETDAPVFPDHPCGDIPEFTKYLTRAGIQAWWEFIPARIEYDRDEERIHDSFELYQRVQFGDLVTLLLTDERLFRSRPLSRGEKLLKRWIRPDDSRTMLGESQREWLQTGLRESETLWSAWANAVLFKPLYFLESDLLFWHDSWSGFESERSLIIETLTALRESDETTVVTLTGDMHLTLATLIRNSAGGGSPVGVEFMTPSVTSVNPTERAEEKVCTSVECVMPSTTIPDLSGGTTEIDDLCGRLAGQLTSELIEFLSDSWFAQRLSEFERLPGFALADGSHWGYSVIEFSREACTWDVYAVDKTVNSAEAECEPLYRLRVPLGEYTIQKHHEELRETNQSSSGYD